MITKKLALSLIATMTIGTGLVFTAAASKTQESTSAATETTVYYAISDADRSGYTVKLNINRKGDGSDWKQYTMIDTGNTYEEAEVFYYTYTDLYNGVGAMQFQLYDDSNQWVSQDQPISSWTAVDNYNGKLYVHGGSGFIDYDPPAPVITPSYYLYDPENVLGTSANIYYWNTGSSPVSWPGSSMTLIAHNLYYTTEGADYTNVIFNNGTVQTVNIAADNSVEEPCYILSSTQESGKYTGSWDAMANVYALIFNSNVGSVCQDDGSTDIDSLSSEWSTEKTIYGFLSSSSKSTLKNASASESGSTVEKFAAKYDYVAGKYSSLDNFVERSVTNASKNITNSYQSNTALIIVVCALATTSIISCYLVVRLKKKHE